MSPCAASTEAHVPRACAPQQEKPPQWEACAPQERVVKLENLLNHAVHSNRDTVQTKINILLSHAVVSNSLQHHGL